MSNKDKTKENKQTIFFLIRRKTNIRKTRGQGEKGEGKNERKGGKPKKLSRD